MLVVVAAQFWIFPNLHIKADRVTREPSQNPSDNTYTKLGDYVAHKLQNLGWLRETTKRDNTNVCARESREKQKGIWQIWERGTPKSPLSLGSG